MLPVMQLVTDQLKRRNTLMLPSLLRQLSPRAGFTQSVRRARNTDKSVSSLFQPEPVKSTPDLNVGAELTGALKKRDVVQILSTFAKTSSVKELSAKHGLDDAIFNSAMGHFRRFCVESKTLPTDLHIIISDISRNAGNITDIFPYFLRHAKQMYPHLDCLEELKKISDLRNPANWYPIARSRKRKLIFHSGPTNSGKTYQALRRFMSAKSGVYCGPLKLLAAEVFNKCNQMGTPCDLITGEEHRYAKNASAPANHISCSVEMVNIQNTYEVAIIDEIQLIRDLTRGWAWTRAFLGIAADEIHLCGESSAIPIIESICLTIGEQLEVKTYKRLTKLEIENIALRSFCNVQAGDCIVCFNKNDIFTVSNAIEKLGKKVAVIYGSLPPGTKLAQAARFNDPNDPCKILVATNAIGMGLNLHIRRIIFYSLTQPGLNEKGEIEVSLISVSSALQIAGRAGRYGTQWETGFVTTFKYEDLNVLKQLLQKTPDEIEQAGLHPTPDQIELYAYYLPNAPLSNLIDIFIALCRLDDSLYFICNLDDFKFVADMIEHIPLPLRTKYVFCCAPVNRKVPFTCNMLLKYARQCSKNTPITIQWLCLQIQWPSNVPINLVELVRLEAVFDVLDVYLWLSYRMPDMFPDTDGVRNLQKELDKTIEEGVRVIARLFKAGLSGKSTERSEKIQPNEQSLGKNTLARSLISRGLLTPKMLEQLKVEWSTENSKGKTVNKNYEHNSFISKFRR
ncbi:suv3 RNA helicase [Megachile rotundata]|uniref:suv3 RNA helicase n=1 Tax=Megachile rotundata TaxID=143995 RepID=UPI000258E4F4|nr:PREDICTED: ATP-dependent RNA helicase SUV3 homolog, mitochondrial isoform X1 [Megachile rotundata]